MVRDCAVRADHMRRDGEGLPYFSAPFMSRTALRCLAAVSTSGATAVKLKVMGPPDIERETGLSGGHIFQGECLPEHMWDRRLSPRTPMPGVFLCGAGTYPGGSVIGINGRNAAMEICG